MNTITYLNGRRETFPDYHKFSEMHDVLRETSKHYVSYYDRHGDTHICVYKYAIFDNVVTVCGVTRPINRRRLIPRDYEANNLAAEIVKEVRWDEFLGWSI